MTTKNALLLTLILAFSAFTETEPFDRIVLKDMTVIKASLVKEIGDSLAYFELNDPDFVKHIIALDQVFKWVRTGAPTASSAVKSSAATASPADSSRALRHPLPKMAPIADSEKIKPPVLVQEAATVKDTTEENIPVVDFKAVMAYHEGAEQSNTSVTPKQQKTAAFQPEAPAVQTSPASDIGQGNTGAPVPDGLTRVRLDPPTNFEGVKIIPRSGMLAININPSLSSLGLGLRGWNAWGFGWGAKAAVLWGASSGFTINVELMKSLNSVGRVRWYFFPEIGYQWTTTTTPAMFGLPSTSVDLSFISFVLGIGLEWRTGINRNHGWSVEVGYQGGKAKYKTKSFTYMGQTIPGQENTFSVLPVFLGFSYAYYF